MVSCGGEKNNPDTPPEPQEGNYKTISITPDRTTNFRNPLNGWVLYAGMGGDMENFWDMYSNFPSSVGKVDVSKYANTLLLRGVWSDLNPAEGVYIWQKDLDTPKARSFRALVEGAKARGMKIAFGFGIDSRDKHLFASPQYVRDKGAKVFESMTGSMKVWSPYPDDPIFQQCYEQFIKDFAAEFNNHEVVDFIGGVGLGKWGEYHDCIYSTGDDSPRMAVFDWATKLYMKYFTEVPVALNYHRWLGTGVSWDGKNYDPLSAGMVQKAIDMGFVLGSGAFGMHTYYSTWEKNITSTYRYKAPIVAEGGWVKSSHGDAIKGDGYNNYAEVRAGEFEDSRQAHANTMDFRYDANALTGGGETWSWFNEAYELVERYIQEGVYRLYPEKVTVPQEVEKGKTYSVKHVWRNLGLAYCPTNVKPWKDLYKVAFALLDPETMEPVSIVYDEKAQPCDWIQGKSFEYDFVTDMSWARKGKYIWAVGIVDTKRNNKIGINVTVKSQFLTPGGWVKLSNVIVR